MQISFQYTFLLIAYDIKIFWKDTRNLLEKEEWYNTLLIENCNEAIEKGNIDMFLATVTNNDKIVYFN